MSVEQAFAEYFKPEIQKRGREDFLKGLAFISASSDTQVLGFIKGMAPLKLTFRSAHIADPSFTATCTCSVAAKGGYCKHIWAMLLAVEKKYPEFLGCKTAIEISEANSEKPKTQMSPEAASRAIEYKEKQSHFKKQQYEKQKTWAKQKRLQKKEKLGEIKEPQPREKYSARIEDGLEFFTANGFAMEDLPTMDALNLARKHLSRVFHPDKGGTHAEAIALNHHFETLSGFIAMINK